MKKKIKVYDVLRVLICLFVLFLIVFPFVWLILSTFKTTEGYHKMAAHIMAQSMDNQKLYPGMVQNPPWRII